ncbi:hypothetical protein Zip_08 [Enterococcus phage vB_EfaP_Zip]|uniref:Uncharacterized protein n=1 Tax=Enterococcus phage vB_EfaP_Zip TaxID=2501743 RepID=A0A411B6U5_9CAUD|nr:hypothetical protein H3T63_gp08 [Enterococcus phage vB_EfaP_Zip]QAX97319.1 hypothetical protein Zip_08 [Enterococcus phage vB_EfaP_Zip]
MEDFVRKTKGVRDITSLPLDTSHELDIVSDVKGKIYIKILNRYKELLFDNGTEQWVIDMLNNLEVDVEQLKEDILDVEQTLTELPMIEDNLETVETTLAQINTLFAQMQIDVQGIDLRTAELEREVIQLALKDQELLDKINNLDVEILYSNSNDFTGISSIDNPSLLDAPYYLSKVALGKNIADPTKTFPIKSSAYLIYAGDTEEELVIGQTYTITLKGTKPASQTFALYNYGIFRLGELKPVEGLTDVWSLTFTPEFLQPNFHRDLRIYQYPDSTAGTCQIDWLKIEKGDTRTPNIPYYKYVGINLEVSKNPNDYHWIPLAKSAELAESVDARLTKTISTYDTVNALQNNRLTSLESKVVDTTWQNVTVTEPFTSVTQPQVKKQNGIVYMRGTISNGTGDCFTLPEGFRPPAGAYEMQFRLPCRSANASDYATIYVRPSGLCSIAGVNGTKPIFLSGIIFSTT